VKRLGEWAPASSGRDQEVFEPAERRTWVAAALLSGRGPVVLMYVTRMADGFWKALTEYRDEYGTWTYAPFDTREQAQAWCERTAAILAGGGS
jgi:hypothetical protein